MATLAAAALSSRGRRSHGCAVTPEGCDAQGCDARVATASWPDARGGWPASENARSAPTPRLHWGTVAVGAPLRLADYDGDSAAPRMVPRLGGGEDACDGRRASIRSGEDVGGGGDGVGA
ncbi:unnamed protein product [Lampetra planeri]